jgi:hypothetical protein
LKLPIPDGKNKGKNHPSTDKHCLDALRYWESFLSPFCFSSIHIKENLIMILMLCFFFSWHFRKE